MYQEGFTMHRAKLIIPAVAASLLAFSVFAQDPIIYPANGQSADQTKQDKFECYSWASGETGFDPMVTPQATSAPPPQQAKRGGVGRGAVGGAAVGGIVGGSSGAKKGAATGALVGGMRRSSQSKSQAQAQAQWEQEQAANYQQQRGSYNRAYAACLEARGYSVR
jgi:hypothetical protein